MKRLAALLGVTTVVLGAGVFYLSALLAAPAPSAIGPPPRDLAAESVVFRSDSGSELRGWFILGEPGRPAIVLMHGIRANRLSMTSRARFLRAAGYSVLLFDFQAHGESPGAHMTFGRLEAYDARAALKFVHGRLPGIPVGAIGSSLGGAAALLGPQPLSVDALVLEAVYPRIEAAVGNRIAIRFGSAGRLVTPLMLLQLQLRLGLDPAELEPVRQVSEVGCPVLVIAGSIDAHTTLADSEQLFSAAHAPKELWVVEGAAHLDFHRFAGAEYERRVLDFFKHNLSPGAA